MSNDRPLSATALPRPARLALRIPDAGSSGLIDVAELRAEPLVPSLAAALSRPPPVTEPRPRAWSKLALRSALALGVVIGLGAALRLAPSTFREGPRGADGQLSLHEASSSPQVRVSVPGSDRAHGPALARVDTTRARAEASERGVAAKPEPPVIQEPPVATAPEPAAEAAPTRPGRMRSRPDAAPSPRERATAESRRTSGSAIPLECVLDPHACDRAKPSADPAAPSASERPSPLPEKLSTAQIKAALASTKADARRCGPEHGADAGTTVRVQLSIEGATGSVLSAAAQGEHAQGALGLCVARALRQTEFPRFTAKRMGTLYSIRL